MHQMLPLCWLLSFFSHSRGKEAGALTKQPGRHALTLPGPRWAHLPCISPEARVGEVSAGTVLGAL